MAIIGETVHYCAACGEMAEFNESWMDWVCEICANGSWREEIKRRVASFDGGVTIHMILKKVSEKTRLTPEQICIKTKKREIVEARQVAMSMAVAENLGNFIFIGSELGGFDHATVSHAIKTVCNLMETNTKFKEKWEGIKLPERRERMKLEQPQQIRSRSAYKPRRKYKKRGSE